MSESTRQRTVREEGERWEEYVTEYLRRELVKRGFSVYRERNLPQVLRERLLCKVGSLWGAVDLEEIGDTKPLFGDVDIVIAKGNQPIAIVSCKLSLHNRLTETLFWSIVYHRAGIRFILVTPDKGHSGRSEWGSPNRPNKNRRLARRFLCGVYVKNHPAFCPPTVETKFGDIVKPLTDLPEDIQKWALQSEALSS
ncbi:MAG: hypothetical protein GDYSWBUE_001035 [Candidatus Fervidibacterota bacterium]